MEQIRSTLVCHVERRAWTIAFPDSPMVVYEQSFRGAGAAYGIGAMRAHVRKTPRRSLVLERLEHRGNVFRPGVRGDVMGGSRDESPALPHVIKKPFDLFTYALGARIG